MSSGVPFGNSLSKNRQVKPDLKTKTPVQQNTGSQTIPPKTPVPQTGKDVQVSWDAQTAHQAQLTQAALLVQKSKAETNDVMKTKALKDDGSIMDPPKPHDNPKPLDPKKADEIRDKIKENEDLNRIIGDKGWNPEKIRDVLVNPEKTYPSKDLAEIHPTTGKPNRNRGNETTIFEDKSGDWVEVNNHNGKITSISRKGAKDASESQNSIKRPMDDRQWQRDRGKFRRIQE